ncbi:PAS domain S-box protein [Pseudodesulfovibrio sp.]|uniref:PAS domain S-box protein n=1 Tax=unclassified Pseudodesulfovibrio TaxID=2661612 RepID=UPI003B00CF72
MFLIVIASTLLQFAAGFLALRLIADSGRNRAWLLLAAGIFAMAFRRLHSLITVYRSGETLSPAYELLGLAISILIFAGIYHIAPLLREMRQSTHKLKESEKRYRTVAEFTHDWESWLTPDGKFAYVSPACERISGYPPEAFKADADLFINIIHPEDRKSVIKRFSSLESMRKPMQFDYRLLDAHGKVRWIGYHSVPVSGDNGVHLGVRASIRDLDRRKKLENELRENRALYRNLVENSRTMVLRFDTRGIVTFANSCAINHMKTDRESIVGRKLTEVLQLAEKENAAERAAIADCLKTGGPLELESCLVNPDGSETWLEWSGSAMADENGIVWEFVCVGIDATRRKHLDKLKEDMTRIVNHDMRSPLTGIIGIPRVLREAENLTPAQKEMLEAVEEAGSIILEMINQSLNLYKLEAGTYQFDLRDFDLPKLLEDVAQHLQPKGRDENALRITLSGAPVSPDDRLAIRGDRTLLYSMFCNLIRNALEARESQAVAVDISAKGLLQIRITNAGVVHPQIRETFFDKYVTMGKSGGTGLGTYSARLIARQQGGDVTMNSSEKSGTTVTVTLPTDSRQH